MLQAAIRWRNRVRHPLRNMTLLAVTLGGAAQAQAQAQPQREFTVTPRFISGGRGNDPGEFGVPESVVLDSRGQIAVTDKGRMMVHVYSRHTGAALFSVGQLGSALGNFNRPNGIAVDSQGRIFVVEQRNTRVQVFDPDYRSLGTFGSLGSGDGRFQKPMGIAIDSRDRIFVTDESRGDVQVFDASGNFLWSFAKTNPRLRQVESIEVDEVLERILVCDEGNSRVNLYDLQGHFLESFGEQGSGEGQFGNDPNAIRVDGKQRIWVNDQGNQRINVYAPDLSFIASFRNAANGMESADGMELSEKHNLLLVADQGNDRVLAFDLIELQAVLETVESPVAARDVVGLAALPEVDDGDQARPLWERTRLLLQATGDGDPGRIDVAIARVASTRDPRGILVRLQETGLDSGTFRGSVRLSDRSDETQGLLAARAGDTVRGHLATRTWAFEEPVLPLPEPEILQLGAGPGELDRLHLDAALHWTFRDPAGVRPQDGFEITLCAPNGTLLWSSGTVDSPQESFALPETLLPGASPRLARVRLRCEDQWSTPAQLMIQRNIPPPLPTRIDPPDAQVLHQWPPHLRVFGLVDAAPQEEGQQVRVRFEARSPWGRWQRSDALPLTNEPWIEWFPGGFNVMENESLEWRVLVDDGVETRVGPWWLVYRDELAELPNLPTLVSPRMGDWIYDDEIELQWTAVQDPDPLQQASIEFEWRHTADRVWHRQTPTGELTHHWSGTNADGAIDWRLRIQDQTGRVSLTPIHRMILERHWWITVQVRNERRESMPLTLGMRPGARDATVSGEDVLAPLDTSGPEIVSLSGEPLTAKTPLGNRRLVDFRRPASPAAFPDGIAYEILVRGLPGEVLELHMGDSDLPQRWQLVWRDGQGDAPAPWPAAQPLRLRLNDAGEAHGAIVLQSPSGMPRPGERRPDDTTPINAQHDTGKQTAPIRPAGLREHLAALTNPLLPGTRLLPRRFEGRIDLSLYDVRGRRVHSWQGPASDVRAGEVFGQGGLPSGVYLLHLHTTTERAQRKVVWTRQ